MGTEYYFKRQNQTQTPYIFCNIEEHKLKKNLDKSLTFSLPWNPPDCWRSRITKAWMIQTNTFWTLPRKTWWCENSGFSRECMQVAASPDILKQFPCLAKETLVSEWACLRVRKVEYVNDTHVLLQEWCRPPKGLAEQNLITLLSETDPKVETST